MDDLARVIAEAHGYDWEDFSEDQRMWHRKASTAVRTLLTSDEAVERACGAYATFIWPESNWPDDWSDSERDEDRERMSAALTALLGEPNDGR